MPVPTAPTSTTLNTMAVSPEQKTRVRFPTNICTLLYVLNGRFLDVRVKWRKQRCNAEDDGAYIDHITWNPLERNNKLNGFEFYINTPDRNSLMLHTDYLSNQGGINTDQPGSYRHPTRDLLLLVSGQADITYGGIWQSLGNLFPYRVRMLYRKSMITWLIPEPTKMIAGNTDHNNPDTTYNLPDSESPPPSIPILHRYESLAPPAPVSPPNSPRITSHYPPTNTTRSGRNLHLDLERLSTEDRGEGVLLVSPIAYDFDEDVVQAFINEYV